VLQGKGGEVTLWKRWFRPGATEVATLQDCQRADFGFNCLFDMDLTRTAYGTWSGGRYMHFGEPLGEERFVKVIQHAWQRGIRTFMTADVYGNGAADEMLGRALTGLPRDS